MAHYQNAARIEDMLADPRAGENLLPDWGRPEFKTASFFVIWGDERGGGNARRAKSSPMASCGICAAGILARAVGSKFKVLSR